MKLNRNMLNEDKTFIKKYKKRIRFVLEDNCGFDPIDNKQLFREAKLFDMKISRDRASGFIESLRLLISI